MSTLWYYPPLSEARQEQPLLQAIRLRLEKQEIGRAIWHGDAEAGSGIVQIVDIAVISEHQRRGHGRKLLHALIEQARAFHQSHNGYLRRAWAAVPQKKAVIARAFFTANGFHHTSTVTGLYVKEDLLVYVRSFD